MEIYNEKVNDLLNPVRKDLDIRESISHGVYIQDLTAKECKDEAEMIKNLEKGEEARITAATNLNEQSSRSHTVFRFNIETKEKKKNGVLSIRTSQFNLVDLAGSEGVSKTRAEGIRFREGSNINKSLLALSKVIHRLSSCQGKNKMFINYRDSKLTRILQPSLGGNSKTTVICTLSQVFSNYQESVKTLLFGQMAKNVKTIVNVNEVVKNKDVLELKAAKQENEELKDMIQQLESKLKELSKAQESKGKLTPFGTPQVQGKNKEYHSAKVEMNKDVEMEVESRNEPSNHSSGSTNNTTVQYLKEQIAYLHSKIFEKSEEIERKDATIRRIETEKSEFEQKFEVADIKESEARRELEILKEEMNKRGEYNIADICKEVEKEDQDRSMLDSDGIKCFSFSQDEMNDDSNILSAIENKPDVRPEHERCQHKERQLKKLIADQEKNVKKLNRELELLMDNSQHMKEEIRSISESERLKTEDLECAEREIVKLNEDIKFYQETNKELMNSIDEVERALQEVETTQIFQTSNENSNNDNSFSKASTRALAEENEKLKDELHDLKNELEDAKYNLKRAKDEKEMAEQSLSTAESNIEILNETLEFISNENIHFKSKF